LDGLLAFSVIPWVVIGLVVLGVIAFVGIRRGE
jgi:hypothetical protein